MTLFTSFTCINCFSMISVIPIYSCMKKRDLKNFTIASSAAISICVFTYTGNVILQEWSLEANYNLLSCVLHTADLPMKKLCNTGDWYDPVSIPFSKFLCTMYVQWKTRTFLMFSVESIYHY